MLASNIPAKIPLPFAASGSKNAIPTASQIGITPGAASLMDGFPPLTFTPLAAGGVPPAGADFNGILNMITAMQQWQSAGGAFKYDSAFSTAVGGYPKGAVLAKATNDGFWLNGADSNTTNPDAGGANWSDLGASFGGRPGRVYAASDWAYLDKPGGLIVQWGQFAYTLGVTSTVAFPLAFPSSCFMFDASPYANNPSDFSSRGASLVSLSPSSASVNISGGATTTTTFTWIAIGK